MPKEPKEVETAQAETLTGKNRSAVLACLACRWAARDAAGQDRFALVGEISQCRKVPREVVYRVLNDLVSLRLVKKNKVELNAAALASYQPADSALGEEFAKSLDIPEECLLHDEKADPAKEELLLWLLATRESEETTRRLIYVSEERWAKLEQLAKQASDSLGVNVTRTKIVDFLMSRGIDQLESDDTET